MRQRILVLLISVFAFGVLGCPQEKTESVEESESVPAPAPDRKRQPVMEKPEEEGGADKAEEAPSGGGLEMGDETGKGAPPYGIRGNHKEASPAKSQDGKPTESDDVELHPIPVTAD